jgi:branched-subunit amino acid aminotransferase/4-amino-4-deoxychorismate lyase
MIISDSTTLRYGIGCFETILVNKEKIFHLQAHLERLLGGAKVCGIPEFDIRLAKNKVEDFVNVNNPQSESILRLILTPEKGLEMFITEYKREKKILKLTISKAWRIDSSSPLNGFKSFNYLKNHLAHKEALNEGFDDAVLLNERGEVCETTRANIFFLGHDDKWVTPPLSSGCLPGIMRAELIKELDAAEKTIYTSQLESDFKDCFVCNSVILRQEVQRINFS